MGSRRVYQRRHRTTLSTAPIDSAFQDFSPSCWQPAPALGSLFINILPWSDRAACLSMRFRPGKGGRELSRPSGTALREVPMPAVTETGNLAEKQLRSACAELDRRLRA